MACKNKYYKNNAARPPRTCRQTLRVPAKSQRHTAEAFLPKQKEFPRTTQAQIQLLAQGNVELNQRVDEVTEDVKSVKEEMQMIKDELPILPLEADNNCFVAVKRKGVEVLGGKSASAYNDRGLRQKLYNDLYANLKHISMSGRIRRFEGKTLKRRFGL